MNKSVILVVVLIIVVGVGYLLFRHKSGGGSPGNGGVKDGWDAGKINALTTLLTAAVTQIASTCGGSVSDVVSCVINQITHTYTNDEYNKLSADNSPNLDAILTKCCQSPSPSHQLVSNCPPSHVWDDKSKACLLNEILTWPIFPTTCNNSMLNTAAATQIRDWMLLHIEADPSYWYNLSDMRRFSGALEAVQSICDKPVQGTISWTGDQKDRLKFQLTSNYNNTVGGTLYGMCNGCGVDAVADQIAKSMSPNQWDAALYVLDRQDDRVPSPAVVSAVKGFCADKGKCCPDKNKCQAQL